MLNHLRFKGLFRSSLVLIACCMICSCSSKQQEQPNIIYILADDLSYRDLSSFGQERFQTPNLDKLATGGVRFTQAYAAAPECAPSRGCLLTGLHTGHGPIRVNSSARGQEYLNDSDLTIAEVLKEAGYRTGFAGKWGVGLPGSEGVPYKQGFDYAFGYYDQGRAHTFIPYYLYENDSIIRYPENFGFDMAKRYVQSQPSNTYDENGDLYIEELKDPKGFTFSENAIEDAAFKFLENNDPQETGHPFFLYFATQLPHGPVIVPHLGVMKEPEDVYIKTREWAAMVIMLDDFVGELIAYLKSIDQYDNTIIFFSSDNGYSMCGYMARGNAPDWPDDPWLQNKGPFTGGKFSVLEGGCRIPFFVSWPGKIDPGVFNDPVWLPDFFPTAVELAGLQTEDFYTDGISLLPALFGKPDLWKGHEFLYFSKQREQAVRIGPWKAYRQDPESKTELYLIEEDTYGLRNLASLYPSVVQQAEEIMDTQHDPHPWYWNPNETRAEYQKKLDQVAKEGKSLGGYRPNGMNGLPWDQ